MRVGVGAVSYQLSAKQKLSRSASKAFSDRYGRGSKRATASRRPFGGACAALERREPLGDRKTPYSPGSAAGVSLSMRMKPMMLARLTGFLRPAKVILVPGAKFLGLVRKASSAS